MYKKKLLERKMNFELFLLIFYWNNLLEFYLFSRKNDKVNSVI